MGFLKVRLEELKEFTCDTCNKDKKSKNIVLTPNQSTICNGCYGEIMKHK